MKQLICGTGKFNPMPPWNRTVWWAPALIAAVLASVFPVLPSGNRNEEICHDLRCGLVAIGFFYIPIAAMVRFVRWLGRGNLKQPPGFSMLLKQDLVSSDKGKQPRAH